MPAVLPNYTAIGGTGGGSIPSLNPPANVTIVGIVYNYIWGPGAQASSTRPTGLRITASYSKPGAWTGKGIHVYYEDPDQSAQASFTLGASLLDGTAQLAGAWNPIDDGKSPDDGSNQITIDITTIPNEIKDIRVYLAAYNLNTDNKLVRATAASPTPNVVITIAPPPPLASGVEKTQLVTNLAATSAYGLGGNGQPVLVITTTWTNPADARYQGSVLILNRPPAAFLPSSTRTGTLLQNNGFSLQMAAIATGESFTYELSAYPTISEQDSIYALSVDIDGRPNTYVKGVTPEFQIKLDPPPLGDSGQEYTSLIPFASVSAGAGIILSGEGVQLYDFAGTFTRPTAQQDPTYAGCAFYVRNQAGAGTIDPITGIGTLDIQLGKTWESSFSTDYWPLHDTEPTWDLYFVSYGVNGQNKLVPGVTPRVTGIHPTATAGVGLRLQKADPTTIGASLAIIGPQLDVADLGIFTGKIASVAVTTVKIADLNISTAKLALLAVDTTILAANAVTTVKLALLAVDSTILAAAAVTTPKVAAANITTALIANAAITTALVANAAITTALVGTAQITTALIANLAVTTALIANAAVGTAQIANAAITTALIANAAITNALIANASINDAKISDLSATKLTAGTITAVTITTATINGGAITGTTLVVNLNSITTSINNTTQSGVTCGLICLDHGGTVSVAFVNPAGYGLSYGGTTVAALNQSGYGYCFVGSADGLRSAQLHGDADGVSGGLFINAQVVLKKRQTDPGAPSFTVLADAQTWCGNLRTALRNHGMI